MSIQTTTYLYTGAGYAKVALWLAALKKYAAAHKFVSIAIALAIVGAGWWAYSSATAASAETRYVIGAVAKGTIVSSVSATGQVSALNQIEIPSKVSGEVVSVKVAAGQTVKAGALIVQIDAGDAAYALESARISYDKLVTVDPSDLRDAESAAVQAKEDLEEAYVSARASLTSASTDMSDVLSGLDALFSSNGYLKPNQFGLSAISKDYIDRAESSYYDAAKLLKDLIKKYRTVSAQTGEKEIETMIGGSYDTAVVVAQAAKYSQDAVVYLRDLEDTDSLAANDAYASAVDLVATANAVVSSLYSAKSAVTTGKRELVNAQNDLVDLKDGPDSLSLRSEQLSLRQKQDALADYYIRAPFDGTIAALEVKKGSTAGNGDAVAILITKQKIAELSLNEVDAAKIKVGNKVTLTFDAIEALTLTGTVAQIDTLGTVSQGVVSYTVKIGFDSQDERIKPGMTVNAAIITDARQDVLMVPSSAVRTQGGTNFVQIFDPPVPETGGTQGVVPERPPQQVPVEVGISDDVNTEIVSGLVEGEQVAVRTVSGAAQTTAQSAPSLFGGGGLRTGAGGVRTGGGGGVEFGH